MKLTWNGKWMNGGENDEYKYRKGWWNYLTRNIQFPNSTIAQRIVERSYEGDGSELKKYITHRTDDNENRKTVIDNVCGELRGAHGPYLDIGSMNGIITAGVAHQLDIDNACGLDIYPVYNEEIISINYDENGDINLNDMSINLVTCLQLIHHVPEAELRQLIRNIARVCCPGAIFYIKDHDYNGEKGFKKYLEAVHLYHKIANSEEFTLPIIYRTRNEILNMLSEWFVIPQLLTEPYGLQRIFTVKLCRRAYYLDGWNNQLFGSYILSMYTDYYSSFFHNDGIALELFTPIIPELNTISEGINDEDFMACFRHWIETLLSVWELDNHVGYDQYNGSIINIDIDSTNYYFYGHEM